MAEQRFTPEEQLLNLIEKGGEPETVKFKRKRKFLFGLGNLKLRLFSLRKGMLHSLARLKSGVKEPNLKVLNKVFLVISLILLSYSIVEFVFVRSDIEAVFKKAKRPIKKEAEEKPLLEPRPFLHHLEMVRRRDIFSPIRLKEAEKPEVKKKQLQEMAKDLSLVGISWGEEPLAMVEDKKANKTHFLKKGDMLDNLKVEDVLKDRVILSFMGETMELM